jgi:hypothetical protein
MSHSNFSGKPPVLLAPLLGGILLLTFAIYKDYIFDVTIKPTSISIVGQPGSLRLPPTRDR